MKRRIAIGEFEGEAYVFDFMDTERDRYANEDIGLDMTHPYIRFVNAKTLPELLSALDGIKEAQTSHSLMGYGNVAADLLSPCTDHKAIAKLFKEKPRKDDVARVRESTEIWGFKAEELKIQKGSKPLANALEEILEAQRDLRNYCIALDAIREPREGFEFTFPRISFFGDSLIRGLYIRLLDSLARAEIGTRFNSSHAIQIKHDDIGVCVDEAFFMAGGKIEELALELRGYETIGGKKALTDDEREQEQETARYVIAVFDMMVSGIRKGFGISAKDSRPKVLDRNEYEICLMWEYFARGITQEGGKGAIRVCPHCKRLFMQGRNTKTYCSRSCTEMARRDRKRAKGGENNGED